MGVSMDPDLGGGEAAIEDPDGAASSRGPILRWARHLVFPITLVGGLLIARAVLSSEAPPESVVLIWFVMMPWVATLERLMPRHPDWNTSKGDVLADVIYLPTSLVVGGTLAALYGGLYLFLAIRLQAAIGSEVWPDAWPLALQVVFACLLAELFAYWPHRWMHENDLLWRFHAVHHSPRRVYWLNAVRAHPGEHVFRGLLSGIPLAVAGAPPEVLAYVMVVSRMAGLFQHANIDFALGPFAWIFSIGELHRWHHAADKRLADHNFGDTLIVWDAVFGSRHLPANQPAPHEVGIRGLDAFPDGWLAQMAVPFRWAALEAESEAVRREGAR